MDKYGTMETPDWTPSGRWRGFNLLGMFRAPSLGLVSDPRVDGHFPEWEFESLRDWGFNFARLPIDYRFLTTGDSWTNLSEEKLSRIDRAIECGRRCGVHVQVAFHRIPGYCILDETEAFPLGTSDIAQEAACALWEALARRWRGIPNEVLSFNLFNEPSRHTSGANYPPLALRLVKAIRSGDPDRFIMADGDATASLPVSALYPVPSLGQAFRGYTPHVLTHFGCGFLEGIPDAPPPTWPLPPNYGWGWVTEAPEMTIAKIQPAIDAGEYCMIGEFGCRNTAPHAAAIAWMRHCLALWNDKGLGWALWNLRGSNGILDSGRTDVAYEDYRGHLLDRQMLELLRAN